MDDIGKNDRLAGLALARMEAECEVTGISSTKVKDGEFFFFSVDALRGLLESAVASPGKRVSLFVRTGPELKLEHAA